MMKTTLRAMVATVSQRGVLMRWWMQVARSDQLLKHEMQQKLVRAGAQWLAFALLDPAAPGSIPGIPEIFTEKKLLMSLRH